jgi:hypothetical protein
MDPRERADAALARARARGAFVVTPDDAISPMDATSTLQIPRSVVTAADNADNTMVISRNQIDQAQNRPHQTQPLPTQPMQAPQYPVEQPYPEQEEPPAPRSVDGLVPTMQQPGPQRSLLSRRLDGN